MHGDTYLAFRSSSLQHLLKLLVVVAPYGCADGNFWHVVGGHGAPMYLVDEEPLQASVTVEITEAIAIGKRFFPADSKIGAFQGGHLAYSFSNGFLCGEGGHRVPFF